MCQNKIKTACSIGKINRDRKKNQTYLRTKKERTSLLSTSPSSLSADRTTDDTCISTKYSCNIQFCLNCNYSSRKDKFEQSDLCDKELTTQNNMEHSNCIYSHASTSQKISTHQMQTTQHYSMSQRTMHTETQLNNSKGFHSHKKGANASNKHQTGKNTMSRSKFHNLAKAIANAKKKLVLRPQWFKNGSTEHTWISQMTQIDNFFYEQQDSLEIVAYIIYSW